MDSTIILVTYEVVMEPVLRFNHEFDHIESVNVTDSPN